MIQSYSRGHKIYFDGTVWRYKDNNDIADHDRPCARCGKMPTPEGYDACLGYIEGVSSACCGHGVEEPIMIFENEEK